MRTQVDDENATKLKPIERFKKQKNDTNNNSTL